ncbi:MAG: flagellar hook-basal body complex protein [Lachnospiraceae bacterium]|nr:flagellar hook-basal body complex protein [Lachnospiraceae bacterium]
MMRAMYSGVAGLKTHQTKMDVIGNNIANVNTVAYKSQSITFAELMYQTTQRASGPNSNTGTAGRNARQIGLGVKSAAIGMAIETPGATQTTGNPFDLRITGDAFFIVSDGSNNYFTRDGSFYVDAVGNLAMSSNGYNVMGWQVDPETGGIKKDTVSALRIMSPDNMTYPPEATSKGYVSGIVDSDDVQVHSESGRILNLSFFDNLGYVYTAKLSMKATGTDHVFTVELDKILDSNGKEVDVDATFGVTQNVADPKTLTLSSAYTFNNTNKSITYTDENGDEQTITLNSNALTDDQKSRIANAFGFSSYDEFTKHYITDDTGTTTRLIDAINGGTFGNLLDADGNLSVTGKSITGGLIEYDASTGLLKSVNGLSNNLSLSLSFGDQEIPAGPFHTIDIDFSASTNFGNNGVTTIGADPGDKAGNGTGRMVGELSEITIQQDGMIYASYDNGQTKLLGQIAVAEFPNPMGLEKRGDNLYGATLNSGEFDGIGVDITGNGGYMETGVLEMSNVDLSTEFTEMITAQRGFQANSRIITVSDTLLEELVNLKR